MSAASDLLVDAFDRIHQTVLSVLDGITSDELGGRPDPDANSVAWLVWHLTRIQDDHIAEVAGTEQRWTADDFYGRFALPFDRSATGYGQSAEEVATLSSAPADLLGDYLEAVHRTTVDYVAALSDDDFDRVVDTRWDPPVTLGVRLVSVITDNLEHAGQAAYVKGLLSRC